MRQIKIRKFDLDEVLVVSLYSYSAAFPFTRMNNKKR